MRLWRAFAFLCWAGTFPAGATETVLLVGSDGRVGQLFTVDAGLYLATLDAGAAIADPATGCGIGGLCRAAAPSAFTGLLDPSGVGWAAPALAPPSPPAAPTATADAGRRWPELLTWGALALGFVLVTGLLRGSGRADGGIG